MANPDNSLNYDQILAALRLKREQIDEAILAIERLARSEEKGGRHFPQVQRTLTESASAGTPVSPKKRVLSEAGRKRIIVAAKKRWRLIRAAEGAAGTKKVAGRKSSTKKAG
jgi:hypothetical protein